MASDVGNRSLELCGDKPGTLREIRSSLCTLVKSFQDVFNHAIRGFDCTLDLIHGISDPVLQPSCTGIYFCFELNNSLIELLKPLCRSLTLIRINHRSLPRASASFE